MSNLTLDSTIIEAFASAGIHLTHMPEGNQGKGLWQHDGGSYGAIVELWVGLNGTGNVGVFGTYDAGDFGNQYGLSCNMSDWLENFSQYLPFMAKGEEFDW